MSERSAHDAQRLHHRAWAAARSMARKPAARLGLALALTTPVLAAGVSATSTQDTAEQVLDSAASTTGEGATALLDLSEFADRADRASRSAVRTTRPVTMNPKPVDRRWTTTALNVWAGPEKGAKKLGLIKPLTKVAVTGQRDKGRVEILLGKKQRNDRWVTAGYLADSKPKPKRASSGSGSSSGGSTGATSTGISGAPCADGSSIESGLTSNAVRVYRAVCNAFPQLTTYGGLDGHGEHVDGTSIDFMTPDKATGDAIASFLLAHAGEFNLYDVIWYQQIWTAQRSSEGWRFYGDYGSPTANHMDHVHMKVN